MGPARGTHEFCTSAGEDRPVKHTTRRPGRTTIGDHNPCAQCSASCFSCSPPSRRASPASRPASRPTSPPPAASSGSAAGIPGFGFLFFLPVRRLPVLRVRRPPAGRPVGHASGPRAVGRDARRRSAARVDRGAHRRLHEEERPAATPATAATASPPAPRPPRPTDPHPAGAGRVSSPGVTPSSEPLDAHDPRRRGRAPDRRSRPRLPRARRLRRALGGRRGGRPRARSAPAGPTPSSWTSACRGSTASTSSGRSAATRRSPSSSSRRAATRRTGSRDSSSAPTTTSSSRSAPRSSSRASAPSCGAPTRPRHRTGGSSRATSSLTSPAGA